MDADVRQFPITHHHFAALHDAADIQFTRLGREGVEVIAGDIGECTGLDANAIKAILVETVA